MADEPDREPSMLKAPTITVGGVELTDEQAFVVLFALEESERQMGGGDLTDYNDAYHCVCEAIALIRLSEAFSGARLGAAAREFNIRLRE